MSAVTAPPPRTIAQRCADVRERLAAEHHLWIATGDGDRGAHLIPLAYAWDGTRLTVATRERNKTVRNVVRSGRARVALGSPTDVVVIDATVTRSDADPHDPALDATFSRLPLDPRRVPGVVCLHLRPVRIQAWRNLPEIAGRTIMRDGRWLG